MKRALLLIVLSTALLTLGFAQTPDTGTDTGAAAPPAANAAPPAATVNPPPQTAIPPATETVAPPPATASPAADTVIPPAATVSPSPETVTPPAAKAAHAAPLSKHPRRASGAKDAAAPVPAATVSPSPETVTPLPSEAATPAANAIPSSETVSTPAPVATPQPVVAHKGRSTWLLVSVAVLVLVLGTLIPAFGRWRKQRKLEDTEAPNLSFTNETVPEPETTEPRKAA